MDEQRDKWEKVKKALEEAGKTKSYYYWMACRELEVDPGYAEDDE